MEHFGGKLPASDQQESAENKGFLLQELKGHNQSLIREEIERQNIARIQSNEAESERYQEKLEDFEQKLEAA